MKQGGEGDETGAGESVGAHVQAAVPGDSAAALSKAWCHAEHCLPLDDVVRREVWEGSIPIRLELARQDVSTFEPPMPFYLQVTTVGAVCIRGRTVLLFLPAAAEGRLPQRGNKPLLQPPNH